MAPGQVVPAACIALKVISAVIFTIPAHDALQGSVAFGFVLALLALERRDAAIGKADCLTPNFGIPAVIATSEYLPASDGSRIRLSRPPG
jgi:hypothetical protein